MTSAPQATCGFSMPRLARRAPLCRSTRKPATLVVPRSTARPRVAAARAAKTRSARARGYARAATSRRRAAPRAVAGRRPDRPRAAAARQRADHAVEVRQIVGERRLRNADVAAHHGRIERQDLNGFAGVKFGPHHRRQRARGNLHRRNRTSASPGRRAPIAAFFRCRQPLVVGLVDLALDDRAPGRCRRCRGRRRRR